MGAIGEDCLVLAGLVALCSFLTGLQNNDRAQRMTRLGSLVIFPLCLFSFFCLVSAYVQSDFSLLNVYQNSHTAKPLLYKITGAWGNHEGSMLLWLTIAALFGFLFALKPPALPAPFAARVLATQNALVFLFFCFIFFTSNPFVSLFPVPLQGLGLNPLLQDPALSFHPPMLYCGYVGFSLSFSFAVAGLLTAQINHDWARALRPWALAAWVALTLGIALGSWWAYYELGWGGWWFWDPVENASLIPWLSGTALIHSLISMEKRHTLKVWTVLLALITFTLALVGTFLVRSGIITSVHAFALDPQRGLFILLLIMLVGGAGLALFALKAGAINDEKNMRPISRESLLVLNNLFLVSACATVLLGTLYPLIVELMGGAPLSVGPPYYEATFTPLMIPLVLLMGLAPFIAWGDDRITRLWPHLKIPALLTLGSSVMIFMIFSAQELRFYLGMLLALWLATTTAHDVWQKRRALHLKSCAMHMAHMGLAVFLFGAVATSHVSTEALDLLKVGDRMQMGTISLSFEKIERVEGPNYLADRATFKAASRDGLLAILNPERRFYPESGKLLSEVAIHSNGFADIYLVLGEAQQDDKGALQGWNVRAYYRPLAPWIWVGCLLMGCGGLMAIFAARPLPSYLGRSFI